MGHLTPILTMDRCGLQEPAGLATDDALTWDLVSTGEGINALEAEWTALFHRYGQPHQLFQSFGWVWYWAQCYLDFRVTPAVLVARRAGELVVVAPFAVNRLRGIRILSFLGEPVIQYGDVVMAGDLDRSKILPLVWAELRQRVAFDVGLLRHVRGDAMVAGLMPELGARCVGREDAAFIPLVLDQSFAAYEKRGSQKKRRNRQRLRNRLAEKASVRVEVASAGPRAAELTRICVAQKRSWLAARAMVSTGFADPRFDGFLAELAGGSGPDAGVRVYALTADQTPVAVGMTFETKGRVTAYLISYDLAFEKSGVGVLNVEDIVRGAFERGAHSLDFLPPCAPYKLDWTADDHIVPVEDWLVATTRKGQLAAALLQLRPKVKDWIARSPAWVRRMAAVVLAKL